uniref:Uncharacterized protein n=1 Tax=Panagrolaimus superbus TaxID=310955 RepID=A0A914Z8T5_9BILA
MNENLYKFPSLSNLTPEEHRQLSHNACLTFHCAENLTVSSSAIRCHLNEHTLINPATGYRYHGAYFGPYNTSIDEFLKLPEISCIIYPITMTDGIQKIRYNRYRSYIIPLLYCSMSQRSCNKEKTLAFGGFTLKMLCDFFNNHDALSLYLGQKIYPRGHIASFNLSLLEALCCFCSREVVVRLSSSGKPSKIRLRNDPDLLLQQIENERALADDALQFYKRYLENNPDGLNWNELRIDSFDLGFNNRLTFVSSYPSYFLDNVYAALHHSKSVIDFETLCKTIVGYCDQAPDIRIFRRLTNISELNLLIEMVSPEALEAVETWKDNKKKILYMKIANELALKLNAIQVDFALDFIELFPNKSQLLISLNIWAVNRIAKCVLFASASHTFISEKEMVSKIL